MLKPQYRGLLIVLLLLALLLRQGLAVFLLGLLAVTIVFAALWSRWAPRRLSYARSLSAERAFVGDEVVLTVRVANRKPLGLPGLLVDELIPEKVELPGKRLHPHTQRGMNVLRRHTALRPYEAISWKIPMLCRHRGLFRIGPAHLEATDAFGLVMREIQLAERSSLIVYPQLVALPDLRLRSQHPVGDRRSPRHLLTDPARTVGVRDYRRDDPLKAVHWGATARRGELQTRVYEPTTSLDVAIVLNLDTFEHYWEGVRYDLIEYMISVAASIATEAAHERLGFGLYTNGAPADRGQLVRIAPSRSPAQLSVVLEALATLVPHSVAPFPQLLRRLGPTLSHGATVVLISAVPSEAVQTAMLRLGQRRGKLIWLYAGDAPAPRLPGVEVIPLSMDAIWGERRGQIMTQS